MNQIIPKRQLVLGGAALLLLGIIIARWIAGWGLVTVHVTNVPLSTVIASIAKQGHVTIETSLDTSKPVSLDVDRVPVAVAIDDLATRTDASWRLVYLAAPNKIAVETALVSLRGSGKLDDWTTYYFPQPPFADATGGEVIDPRTLGLSLEGPDKNLSPLMNEAAQKSGAMIAIPKDWSPAASALPKPNQVSKAIPALVKSVHGASTELFFITERGRRGGGPPRGDDGGAPDQQDQRPQFNSDWMEQRQLAQIAKLPPEKQAAAKKDMEDRKALFAEMRKLTPEERRAKFQAMMADPDFMDKIADQMVLRAANQSAEQRINRAVNYINRKAAAKNSQ